MEVILADFLGKREDLGILHVCGGDPRPTLPCISTLEVFSTYVEVIPECAQCHLCEYCILHVCGGDPDTSDLKLRWCWYSPRMWRWSQTKITIVVNSDVFSTYVEVILEMNDIKILGRSILHVCGGDP